MCVRERHSIKLKTTYTKTKKGKESNTQYASTLVFCFTTTLTLGIQ